MNRLLRKTVVCLLALVFAAALPSVSFAVSATDFTDPFDPSNPDNTAYWGYPYIDYAAKAGIIEGYEQPDGTRVFLPRNNVTKQEAVTMIVNTMTRASFGYPYADYTGNWLTVMEAAHITDWAYPYVAYALEKGFLTAEEVSLFMTASGESYTSVPASREEVITWVGRALWTRHAAYENAVYPLTYSDSADVSSLAAPYLALLSRIGIIEGNENADGSFSFAPKRTITRVEFAVICNKVYEYPKTADKGPSYCSYSGKVRSLSVNGDGTGSFRIGDALIVYRSPKAVLYNGKPVTIGLSGIDDGQTLIASWGSDGLLHLDTQMVSLTGAIVSVRSADPNGYQEMQIRLPDQTVARYYIRPTDSNVSVTGSLTAGKTAAFLADGVNIIELIIK